MRIDLSTWDGRFDLAEWEHNPCGPWLILLDGPHGQVTSTYGGSTEQVLRRFLDMPRDAGPGTMAVIVDSKCKIVYGHIWEDDQPFASLAGCAVMFSVLERVRPGSEADEMVARAFHEMCVRGAFDDLMEEG
jgi:hypothetical protein